MTQQIDFDRSQKKSLPIAGQAPVLDIEAELRKFEDEERGRLGLEAEQHWIEDMANLGFTKSQKSKVTLLIGGLTMAHDYLAAGSFRNLGYNVISMDCPDYDALRVGKEFGNRAQCNPTYFTVGNLVKYLIELRDKHGMPTKDIIEKFVFLTAGACGPCRFGMYVTEYRKALRDAGFDGFRVMLFQQQGGLSQATGEGSGLELNQKFFIGLLKALVAGDIINGVGYRIRPYETVPGATDKAIQEAKEICYNALVEGKSILFALMKAKQLFAQVPVDRLQPKPRVAIIGEFWAMTTEGDGNCALQRFLEQEGAEADIQFVTAWILYNVWEVRFDTKNRALLRSADGSKTGLIDVGEFGVFTRKVSLWAADKAVRALFHTFAYAGGFYDYHLSDMDAVAEVASPFYNNDLRGGEGHMEVGKLILNVVKSKATMTLSVKPFGCMPSSGVSDGVQSLISERYPGTIFCAVETSGDGAVNFYSRVQMYLFKAKIAATAELEKALSDAGITLEQVREFMARHPRYAGALHRAPHTAAATGADLVNEIAELMTKSPWQRMTESAREAFAAGRSALTQGIARGPDHAKAALELSQQLSAELLELARDRAPGIAAKARARIREKAAKILPFAGTQNLAAAAGG